MVLETYELPRPPQHRRLRDRQGQGVHGHKREVIATRPKKYATSTRLKAVFTSFRMHSSRTRSTFDDGSTTEGAPCQQHDQPPH